MLVFKTYFKIIRNRSGQISIYLVIFIALAIMFSYTAPAKEIENFSQSVTRVAFINEDQDTAMIQGFKSFLGKYSEYVEVPDETEKLQKALFYRDVEYILRIPAGFTEDILSGKQVQLEKTVVPGSTSGIYTNMLVNKYFNTARLYLNSNRNTSQEELVKKLAKDLQAEASVQMERTGAKTTGTATTKFYFNYLAYILISVVFLGVSSIMMVFNNQNLKRRNYCSPLKISSLNLQLLLGNIIFGIICWGLIMLVGFVLFKGQMLTSNSMFSALNALVFTAVTLSLSFFISLFVKGVNAQSALANVLSLGLSFISGVFVPQEFLSQQVLAAARFTPTYWFIKANNTINGLSNFTMDNLRPVFNCMLIQLGFAIAILSVALVVSKRNQIKGS